jgi:hypothetical protein
MPFHYEFPMPSFSGVDKVITFNAWLLEMRDRVSAGTPVAVVKSGEQLYRVLANGEGFLWKKSVN